MNFSIIQGKRPRQRNDIAAHVKRYGSAVAESLAETFWPTRCAICDKPGEHLCAPCRLNLPFIDQLRACPTCGAPWGTLQCCECNTFTLGTLGRTALPFAASRSVVMLDNGPSRIVRLYKDHGDRQLAKAMAHLMDDVLPVRWLAGHPSITFVPATADAKARRGFDHAELLAETLAERSGLPLVFVFERPHSKDQRRLSRSKRMLNMAGGITVRRETDVPSSLLLVDDVYTTGSTLMTASDALNEAGTNAVRCLTFARVR